MARTPNEAFDVVIVAGKVAEFEAWRRLNRRYDCWTSGIATDATTLEQRRC